MKRASFRHRSAIAASTLLLMSLSGFSQAQQQQNREHASQAEQSEQLPAQQQGALSTDERVYQDLRMAKAEARVRDAAKVVSNMEADPGVGRLIEESHGVFIVPHHREAAIGIGAGGGLLMARQANGSWSEPVFYNTGEIDIGAQTGAEGGAMAFMLRNEKALDRFMQTDQFSLAADSGMTIIDISKLAEDEAGAADVVVWSGQEGLFADLASIGAQEIHFDHTLNNTYYKKAVGPREIVAGNVTNPQAEPLRQALLEIAPPTTGGATPETSASGTGETDHSSPARATQQQEYPNQEQPAGR